MHFTADELRKLETYLTRKLKLTGVNLKKRERAQDSVEVLIDGEFIGTIYKDTEDGETSYDLNIAILEIDLK
ncbi:MAG: DUF3126 family protein [Rhodospirillales bacterium]|nr:DUF3126 family protein [Alphaproteobacteria bacterium]MCB1839932.1 DUF3126 family protein [Alphaproteobacteria bacterium]MCB9976555.1 DUF3126 family protein [Rhodospirillales bacterium]